MNATRRSYDTVATAYDTAIGDELAGKPVDRALLALVAEAAAGGPVLDAGCGPGHVADWLAGHGARAVGVDLSPAMVARAASRGIRGAAGDLTVLPVQDATVAAIVCFYAVIHLDDDDRVAAYREFARVLRPGGLALIAFHVRDAATGDAAPIVAADFFGHPVDLVFRYLDPAAESARLTAAGLEDVARTDRPPVPGVEHDSDRSYLLVRRPARTRESP